MPQHLTPEQLIAYRDGALEDVRVADHIRRCPECRGELLNARLRSVLVHSGDGGLLTGAPAVFEALAYHEAPAYSAPAESSAPASDHPDDSALAAYYSNALPTGEREEIEAHITGCRGCLDDLVWMRDALAGIDSTPSITRAAEPVVFKLLQRWGTLPGPPPLTPPLGKLFIEMLAGQRTRLVFRPASIAPGRLSPAWAAASPGRSSPSRRRSGESIVREPAGSYPSPAMSSLHINIGPLRLALEVHRTPAGASLRATVIDPGKGVPEPAITITLFTAEGLPIPPEVDASGAVTWRLPPNKSTLSVDADPQVNIEVQPVEE